MEIVKSRYGVERSIERINLNKVRVMGESQFIRKSTKKHDEISMFDFEGGPCFFAGEKMFNSDDGKHDFTNMVISQMREILKDETSKEYMKDMCGVEIRLQRVKSKSKV